ncbi:MULTISPECIES: PHP domain-containing protein [Aminobacterium]|jgi:predicted metal-dependent phosphoesterase TrpH|uniref:PHP domain protein n=1 Tax=Aminobacterium colombiense (strain DSM 12261 / ALA-1) TaxID=572547 RepID=D5ED02_AMICL|nr:MULTISPECIES: PHP domain-containing protein [Aminobacterium]MDD2379616.1 PHP domain-containing protein [Aminobacterium colombiense]ADE56434.1 PHP domain protein [Aminobacterium colombiense DSM 12261]MDD3768130.1 PHP domain-containing protein [Aminobacterium colombiense]MDD4265988.1 PHP domain-containing protein [Aminobacterium colombiense]MDD4586422.1 PHP domain-containing protein [Aminobacterium colombiense]
MIFIDLHLHSTCSDGTITPRALAFKAKSQGLSVASLTDHDTTEGVKAFLKTCARREVRGVAGVELSADFHSVMHILGYRIDVDSPLFQKHMKHLREGRDERNYKICQKLQRLGLSISIEEVQAEAQGEVIARPHIARVLIRKGYVQSMGAAFERYLGREAPAYVPRYRLSPQQCIETIHQAGGVAVLAHPVQTTDDYGELVDILSSLKELGLWGMECLAPSHAPQQVFQYLRIAKEMGLFPTAGSDFHGTNRPGVSMGIRVKFDFLPWARLGISL